MKYNDFDNFTHWYNPHQYHFAHWCAFNMLAMNLGVWKFHHLFHDWYKPLMNDVLLLFYEIDRIYSSIVHRSYSDVSRSYSIVHKFHQKYSNHHLEYFYRTGKCNWLDLILDWECSGYTKEQGKLSAREYLNKLISEGEIQSSSTEARMITELLDKYEL